VPIIKKISFQGEVECIMEVMFLTGENRCISEEEYLTNIEPYEIIVPYKTFVFFKKISLQACALADQSSKAKCEQDVNSLDEWVTQMIEIQKEYNIGVFK